VSQRFSAQLNQASQENMTLKNELDQMFRDLSQSSQQLVRASLDILTLKNEPNEFIQENNQLKSKAFMEESLSNKLEGELVAARAVSSRHLVMKLLLNQQLRELRDKNKSLRREVQEARDGAVLESNKLHRKRNSILSNLKDKLQMT
jgi:hypothetical protein